MSSDEGRLSCSRFRASTDLMFSTRMLDSKRTELSDWANKLRSGLGRIDDTRTKVEGKLLLQ